MADEISPAPADQNEHAQKPDSDWFTKAVGALLLVIIAAQTGLLVKFYRRATAAEAEVARLQANQSRFNPLLQKMLDLKPDERIRIEREPVPNVEEPKGE